MPKKNNRPERNPKPLLHIYCEGKKTEPNYIQGYIDKHFSDNRRLKVIRIENSKKNTAKELVQEAVNQKNNAPGGDIFWVVYDRESEQKYADRLHATAHDQAHDHDISIALSNVCFEIWLLLHFQESSKPFSDYDDLRDNSILRIEFKKRGLTDYDKGEKNIFQIFKEDEINQARERAKRMNSQTQKSADISHTKPYQWNPYSDVYKLLDTIDDFAGKSKGIR